MLTIEKSKIIFRYDAEELWIEPWGPNALRVRATKEAAMPGEDWALTARGQDSGAARLTERGAELVNGKIRAEISRLGKIMIYRADGKPIWNKPLTPYKGKSTISPFVALEKRG